MQEDDTLVFYYLEKLMTVYHETYYGKPWQK
jgi:hypothetical protein